MKRPVQFLFGCLLASTLATVHASVRQDPQELRAESQRAANSTEQLSQFTQLGGGSVLELRDGRIACRGVTEEESGALQRNPVQLHVISEGFRPAMDQTGLKIVLRGTSQLEQFPEAKAAFIRAAHAWELLIQNPITVVIDVDFGTTGFGKPFGENELGNTHFQRFVEENIYSTIRAALIRSAGSPQEAALYNSMPASQLPTDLGGATAMIYHIPAMRALGLFPAVADPEADRAKLGPPPAIAFNASESFDFDPGDGNKPKRFDFTSLATHEIGHALGFFSGVGQTELFPGAPPVADVLDLFRFRPGVTLATFASAQRILSSGGDQVFFGGASELPLSTGRQNYTGGDNRQAGHWKDHLLTGRYVGIMDPTFEEGSRSDLTNNDRDAFELIGYRTNPLLNAQETELKLDDGSMDNGALANGLIVINRLTPSSYPSTLRKLRIVVPTLRDQPNATGQPITLLYAAGNSNGQLPSAVQFNRMRTTVPSASSALFLEFAIPNGPTINGGDFYVGYETPAPHQGVGFAADLSGSSENRSFYSTDGGASFASLSDVYQGKPANALIRAIVAIAGPPAPPPPAGPSPAPTPNIVALTSGVPKDGYIADSSPRGVASNNQYTIQVPSGATQLTIDVNGNTVLDLYVRLNRSISFEEGYRVADFRAISDNFNESITITPASSPALQAGVYYIQLVNYGPGSSSFTITATVSASTPSQGKVVSVSAASFNGDALASDEIVAAFGARLATATVLSSGTLTTELGGTRVTVTDSTGAQRQALLFFVSPGQVNYLMPTGTANGPATITITSGDGAVSTGTTQIASVAPGLFTTNADGKGVPNALSLRVTPGGQQTSEPVFQFDDIQKRFIPKPIDFGSASDQLFLILFGTGIRHRQDLSTIDLRIGGVQVPVLFAGGNGYTGEDQLNVPLPRSLAGRGDVDVTLVVDGKPANTVRVNIR